MKRAALVGLFALGCSSTGPNGGDVARDGIYNYSLTATIGGSPVHVEGDLVTAVAGNALTYQWVSTNGLAGSHQGVAVAGGGGWVVPAILYGATAIHTLKKSGAGWRCTVAFVPPSTGTCALVYSGPDTLRT